MSALTYGQQVRQYALVTFNYWNFTLTDGALRMLVILHFYGLGYSGFEIAMLFLFYEFFGVVTNLVGGWLGARIGLNRTMNLGLLLQISALLMLAVPPHMLSMAWVMAAQAISGIAKDLNKMSAKTSIKSLVKSGSDGQLYVWVARLTGSKNALKGAGFFLGGVLLSWLGFENAMLTMASVLSVVLVGSLWGLKSAMGQASGKPKFTELFSNNATINKLAAARLFLFASRDVWFVIALPLTLAAVLGWSHERTGGFMACWVMAYGVIQGLAPKLTGKHHERAPSQLVWWSLALSAVTAALAFAVSIDWHVAPSLIIALMAFGWLFAVLSSLHSYLIVAYAREDGASLDVGFYYMANAAGRLLGTVLSGWAFQVGGLSVCLWISAAFIVLNAVISKQLPTGD